MHVLTLRSVCLPHCVLLFAWQTKGEVKMVNQKDRSYAVERYQGMAMQTVHGLRQVAIMPREPNCITSKGIKHDINVISRCQYSA